ncbi:hypothetical protein DL96DRAFT_1587859 [Flagelloscypha sp. PMI_526]|nr:hypothetical protein DL96DRAFT_1587859 [Flagelloscypha sp. PMI_526]
MSFPLEKISLNTFEREKVARKASPQRSRAPETTLQEGNSSSGFDIRDENICPHGDSASPAVARVSMHFRNTPLTDSVSDPVGLRPCLKHPKEAVVVVGQKRKRRVSFSSSEERLVIPRASDDSSSRPEESQLSSQKTERPLRFGLVPQTLTPFNSEFASIVFESQQSSLPGILVRDLLREDTQTEIKGANDLVLKKLDGLLKIELVLSWPGYDFTVEKSITLSKTMKDTFTRQDLLYRVVDFLADYVAKILVSGNASTS